jgi:filamentous hemagglutinin
MGNDRYNRMLHPEEKQGIKNLAKGDADKEHRLEAAGCALVHCAAEYAPGTVDYSFTSAAATGAAASGTLYTGSAAAGAYMDYRNGGDFSNSFDQRFSYAGLATAATFGAYSNIFTTQMFNWAGVPNSIQNASSIPGFVIRGVKLALGQTAGKAAQAAVKSGESKKE